MVNDYRSLHRFFLGFAFCFGMLLIFLAGACTIIPEAEDIIGSPSPSSTGGAAPDTPTPLDPTTPSQEQPIDKNDWLTYSNQEYLFTFQYPPAWSLQESPGEQGESEDEALGILELTKGTNRLVIQFQHESGSASLGPGGLPAGEVVEHGTITFFEHQIPKNVLVYEGKDKFVYFEDNPGDLEFFITLDDDPGPEYDYRELSISQETQSEVEAIMGTFSQTSWQDIHPPVEGEPVTAWTGHVQSNPPTSQFDDYLVLMPVGTGEVGLVGVDSEIEDQIVELRDASGVMEYATFWGTLVCPAIDYGGCQIQVSEVHYGQYQTNPEAVDGWEGQVLCSHFTASPDAKCGNAFVLSGQFPVWFGLWSPDPDINSQIDTLRDTGAVIKVWGQIIAGVPDVNGTQIQVDRLEVISEPPTPSPTPTPTPAPTTEPTPCNRAEFVADVTVQDGTVFTPGTLFTKVWRLKNTGSCSWTQDYTLVFVEGDPMTASTIIPIPAVVPPGYTIDLGIDLTAPWVPGNYIGLWELRSFTGEVFGTGDGADQPIWVNISVLEPVIPNTYDFVSNACAAEWSTGARYLSCPAAGYSREGFVIPTNNPNLESRHEDEPALWLHTNESLTGWINGIYPWTMIMEGDRFRSWIGCMGEYKNCDITFRLSYQLENGVVWELGSWQETNNGSVTDINLDLSDLAGQNIRFIFNVEVNSSPQDAHGIWFVPHLERTFDDLPIDQN